MLESDDLKLQWALGYPFGRPPGDFLFLNSESFPLRVNSKPSLLDWEVVRERGVFPLGECLSAENRAEFELGDYQVILAVGSNGSPIQLLRKYRKLGSAIAIPVIKLEISDFLVTYTNRIAPYGSIPSTLTPSPGAKTIIPATILSSNAVALMNKTEQLGEVYKLTSVLSALLPKALHGHGDSVGAYSSISGSLPLRLQEFPSSGGGLPEGGQWAAQEMVIKKLGLSMPVERFVRQNLEDRELRENRDALLANMSDLTGP